MACAAADASSDFEQLKNQSTYTATVRGAGPHPDLRFDTCTVADALRAMYGNRTSGVPTFGDPSAGPKYSVVDDHVVLANSTELVYKLPRNTSVLEVLGPVGSNAAWLGRAMCYAVLDPRPPYWSADITIPWSTSVKYRMDGNRTNETMFFFPLPPDKEYTVRVGNLGQESRCPVGGFRSYPFHL